MTPPKPKPAKPKPAPKPVKKPAVKPVAKPAAKPVKAAPKPKPVKAAPKPKPVKKAAKPKPVKKPEHKKTPEAHAATRPPGTGDKTKPSGPPQINTDSVENMKAGMVAVGEYLKAPARAIIACLVIGYQENTWSVDTCNTTVPPHCGIFQLDAGWQAEHDYRDVTYWTNYAYKNGFYGNGGLIAIANNNPDLEIGMIVQDCQGAGPGPNGQPPQDYYQEAVPEATADYERLKGKAYTTTGGYVPSSPSTPAQHYDAGSAASFYRWPGNYASASTQLDSGAIRGSTRANSAFDYANGKKYLTAPEKKA